MACPTCNHTMQSLGGERWWCPRCGSLKESFNGGRNAVPSLIARIREFVAMIANTPEGRYLRNEMNKAGVLEAVHVPGERREDL